MIKKDGKNEMWWETVRRVVEGTYSMQKNWIDSHQLGWNAWQAQRSAQEMYDRIYNMKFWVEFPMELRKQDFLWNIP